MNYALLVGINEYQVITSLSGCENDVDYVQAYLEQDLHTPFEIKTLKSAQATRANIIDSWREHLGQAGEGDIAFFYFSGHGAKQASPEKLIAYQQDKEHENLCCHDSRANGVPFLADKEIKHLISEVAAKGADVVVIYDCCHSGSGTRNQSLLTTKMKKREVETVKEARTEDSFLPGSLDNLASVPRHVFLAACGPREFSREKPMGQSEDKSYGVFTHALIETLRLPTIQGQISYQDLIYACRHGVRRRLPQGITQTPRLDVGGHFPAMRNFLQPQSAEQAPTSYAMVYNKPKQQWQVNLGTVHGLKIGSVAQFQVMDPNTPGQFMGGVQTTQIGLYESPLQLDFPNHKVMNFQPYRVVPTYLPVEKMLVEVEGETGEFDPLPKAEELVGKVFSLTPVSREAFTAAIDLQPAGSGATYRIAPQADSYALTFAETGGPVAKVPIPRQLDASGVPDLQPLARGLMHISKWQRLLALHNPNNTLWQEADQVAFSFVNMAERHIHTAPYVTLDFHPSRGNLAYQFKMKNLSARPLHVTTLYLSPDYSVDDSMEAKTFEVSHVEKILDENSFTIPLSDDPTLRQVSDIFQVIISAEELPYLNLGSSLTLDEVITGRGMRHRARGGKDYSQAWFTYTLRVKTVLELGQIGPQPFSLDGDKITIDAHPQFKAKVSLISSADHFHGPYPDQDVKGVFEPLGFTLIDFSNRQRKETILELHHIQESDSLVSQPLAIHIKPSQASTSLLAVSLPFSLDPADQAAYPGAFPVLGILTPDGSGRYPLNISQILPNPDDGRAKPGQSLKISFVQAPQEDFVWDDHLVQDKSGQKWFSVAKLT